MGRKVERLTIAAEGRDKGKVFVLTEMDADKGERWFIRAVLALANTGAALPQEALNAGAAGFVAIGLQALGMLPSDVAQPLLDELWPACVRYEHKPGMPLQEIIAGAGSQIEEVGTRFQIYLALLKVHTGFSMPVALPTSGHQQSESGAADADGLLTSMSRGLLGLLSRLGAPH